RLSIARLEAALIAEVRERIEASVRDDIHAAAVATVTAVRATERHELLAAKAHLAPAAVAGLHLDARFVDELHRTPRGKMAPSHLSEARNEQAPGRPGPVC